MDFRYERRYITPRNRRAVKAGSHNLGNTCYPIGSLVSKDVNARRLIVNNTGNVEGEDTASIGNLPDVDIKNCAVVLTYACDGGG